MALGDILLEIADSVALLEARCGLPTAFDDCGIARARPCVHASVCLDVGACVRVRVRLRVRVPRCACACVRVLACACVPFNQGLQLQASSLLRNHTFI
jgi:hypothetical protein